jgi:DNA-binding NarL/FixJ family response regulator
MPPDAPALHVLVLASSPLARAGLAGLVGAPMEVVGNGDPDAALALCRQLEPDVVLIDFARGDEVAEEAAEIILGTLADLPVVGLAPADRGGRLLSMGVGAVLPPDVGATALGAALAAVAAGLVAMSRDHLAGVLPAPVPVTEELPVETLTRRELEILRLMSDGLTNRRMAARLSISEHTVKFHVTAILGKLSSGTRAEAVARAMRLGWIPV